MLSVQLAAEGPFQAALQHVPEHSLGEAPRNPGTDARLASAHSVQAASVGSDSDVGKLQFSGFSIDTSSRRGNLIDYHQHYVTEGNDVDLIQWNGNVTSCDEGSISDTFQDLVRRRINYYRGQAGLSTTIAFDESKNAAAQQAALVMVRQKSLSHTPFTDWPANPCVTPASEVTASASNLSLGSYGLESIDRLILDDGSNNGPVGHRRWFFYPQAVEMGHGSIPFVTNFTSACVVWVVGDFGSVPQAKPVTWPNEGYCPHPLIPNDSVPYPRWSISYPGADFSKARVHMTYDGSEVSLIQEPVKVLIGDNTLVWRPAGIPSTPPPAETDSVARVTITGIESAPFTTYTYNVVIYDPYNLSEPLAFTGPDAPAVSGGTQYDFNPIISADGYRLRVASQAPVSWTEGAETLDTIIDQTSDSYQLQSTTMASSGSRSFHLLFPTFGEQSFEVDRTLIPSESSILRFKRRFRFFYPPSTLYAELSDDEGTSWNPIWETAGTTRIGSSAEWDTTWISESQPIPSQYVGRPVRLRFRIATGGSFFQWTPGNTVAHYGVFIDDAFISETSQLLQENVTELAADATSFVLDAATAGGELSKESSYLVQLAPILGGHQFSYSLPVMLKPTESIVDERTAWLQTHFGSSEEVGSQAPTSDFDEDGLSNLIERALNLNPTQADEPPSVLPTGGVPSSGTLSGRPVMTLTLPTEPHADLIYEVQHSTSLTSWAPLARKAGTGEWQALVPDTIIEESPPEGGRVPLTVAAPTVLFGNGGLHLRLSITAE